MDNNWSFDNFALKKNPTNHDYVTVMSVYCVDNIYIYGFIFLLCRSVSMSIVFTLLQLSRSRGMYDTVNVCYDFFRMHVYQLKFSHIQLNFVSMWSNITICCIQPNFHNYAPYITGFVQDCGNACMLAIVTSLTLSCWYKLLLHSIAMTEVEFRATFQFTSNHISHFHVWIMGCLLQIHVHVIDNAKEDLIRPIVDISIL